MRMPALAWWFRIVGALYLFLGCTFIPAFNVTRLDTLVPGFDGAVDGPAWRGFLDYTFMFGAELLVLGAFLIVASFRPGWFTPLVWLLCAMSVVRGVGHDLYMIASGYTLVGNLLLIAMHVAIIASGLLLLRRAVRSRPGPKRAAESVLTA
jgi:hypothetical protein